MKVLQIATTRGRDCGIALFADNVQTRMRRAGIDMETAAGLPPDVQADVVLLQYHQELISDEEVISLTERSSGPVVLFAHSEGTDAICEHLDGLVAMCSGVIGPTNKPVHIFPHPAWTPPRLEDRTALRREFGLPEGRAIVGTNGFLKWERQFVEIAEALLPEAERNNWFVELITSPWRLESPGLIPRLERLRGRFRHHFRFEYVFLDTQSLNRRLQSFDLLWCWTEAPSSPYASGVISDQYASGTRIFAADKYQHSHVLRLPNAVAGPDSLDSFIEHLIGQIPSCAHQRHDPAPVSWDNCIHDFAEFLRNFAHKARRSPAS